MRNGIKWRRFLTILTLLGAWSGIIWYAQPRFIRELSFHLDPYPDGAELLTLDEIVKPPSWPVSICREDGTFQTSGSRSGVVSPVVTKLPELVGLGAFPKVEFTIALEGFEDIKFHQIGIYDSISGRKFGRGMARKPLPDDRPKQFDVSADVNCWCPTPVAVVVDFLHGAPAIVEARPQSGGFAVETLLGTKRYTVERKKKGTSIRLWKMNWTDVLSMEAVTHSGTIADQSFTRQKGWVPRSIDFDVAPEDIAFYRVTFRNQLQRIILQLDELPGMLEENRSLTNLFDLTIGDCSFSTTGEFENFVADQLNLQLDRQNYPWSGEGFDTKRSTIKQMLRQYEEVYPEAKVTVNHKTRTIRFHNPSMLKERIRDVK